MSHSTSAHSSVELIDKILSLHTILNVLSTSNLNTIEGLQTAIEALKNIEGYEDNVDAQVIVKKMEAQIKTLGENVALSYEAYLSSIAVWTSETPVLSCPSPLPSPRW